MTGKDGSYSPVFQLKVTENTTQPTYDNQLYQAAKLLEDKGYDALESPHAATGRMCGCGDCFCCAAERIAKIVRIHERK